MPRVRRLNQGSINHPYSPLRPVQVKDIVVGQWVWLPKLCRYGVIAEVCSSDSYTCKILLDYNTSRASMSEQIYTICSFAELVGGECQALSHSSGRGSGQNWNINKAKFRELASLDQIRRKQIFDFSNSIKYCEFDKTTLPLEVRALNNIRLLCENVTCGTNICVRLTQAGKIVIQYDFTPETHRKMFEIWQKFHINIMYGLCQPVPAWIVVFGGSTKIQLNWKKR